jgi:hypothetical protein
MMPVIATSGTLASVVDTFVIRLGGTRSSSFAVFLFAVFLFAVFLFAVFLPVTWPAWPAFAARKLSAVVWQVSLMWTLYPCQNRSSP